MPLLLRRTTLILGALLLGGVLVQLPILPPAGDGAGQSLAAAGARAIGVSPARIGVGPLALLSIRKVVTAAVFSLFTACLWGLWRGDSGARLLTGIPRLNARTAAVVRIAFAIALAAAFLYVGPVEPVSPELQRDAGPFAGAAIFRELATSERAARWVHTGMLAAVAMLALGVSSRASTILVAALTTLHVVLLLQRQSAHDWGIPVVALWLLVLVPWGDALSADALWRRRRGAATPMRAPAEYGLSVWIPGLALGVAFFAASFAKLDSSGVAWITSGAVRYHFLADANQTVVDWGQRIAASLAASQAVSFAAVVGEALLILHLLTPAAAPRLAFGLLAVSLLGGFYLFQGVFWAMWWVLLLAFVPWSWLARDAPRPVVESSPYPIRRWQTAVLALFVLQQVVVTAIRFEAEPFLSDYGMYSYTFESTEAFDEYLAGKRGTQFDWSAGRFKPGAVSPPLPESP